MKCTCRVDLCFVFDEHEPDGSLRFGGRLASITRCPMCERAVLMALLVLRFGAIGLGATLPKGDALGLTNDAAVRMLLTELDKPEVVELLKTLRRLRREERRSKDAPKCRSCGRPEPECSFTPCPEVRAEREATDGEAEGGGA